MKFAIITTTINVPTLLKDYLTDAQVFGHKNLKVFIAGDKKTPDAARLYCDALNKSFEQEVVYLGVEDQNNYLKNFPQLASFLPWNSVQRRNVAILKAYEEGYDTIITIDDDNYLNEENYLGGHLQVGAVGDIESISSPTGWLNNCAFLSEKNDRKFFARGYPVTERSQGILDFKINRLMGKVVVNGGLWLGDPDIDAVTRLAAPIDATHYTRKTNFALASGTWCPFNSQNTALAREVIPAYFLSPHVGRFDDIWASYVVERIAGHLGHFISFGHPLVRQNRNVHNLWHDLELEKMGMQWTESFCVSLRETKLSGNSYAACTEELMDALSIWIAREKNLSDDYRGRFQLFVDGYRLWTGLLGK